MKSYHIECVVHVIKLYIKYYLQRIGYYLIFKGDQSRGLAIIKRSRTRPNFYLPPNRWSVQIVKGKQCGIGTRLPMDLLAKSPEQIAAVRHWEKWWEECSPRKNT